MHPQKLSAPFRPGKKRRLKQMTVDLPVRIFIDSSDPDELAGISADLLSTVRQMRGKVIKKYRDQLDGKHQWLIVAAPSPAWAAKVFPGEPEDVAVEKLWNAIFDCLYLKEGEDIEKIWQAHSNRMISKAKWMTEQAFHKLHYTSKNGTDFTVELIPGAKWSGAGDINHLNKVFFVPNMPTEEVFTSPDARQMRRPPCFHQTAQLVPDRLSTTLLLILKDGRVVDCHAEQGEEVLKKNCSPWMTVAFDARRGCTRSEGVPDQPVRSDVSSTHCSMRTHAVMFAAGAGFSEVLDGFMDSE